MFRTVSGMGTICEQFVHIIHKVSKFTFDVVATTDQSTKKTFSLLTVCPLTKPIISVVSRFFEFTATIPVVKDLKIAVMDYDLIGRDDVIGETQIDLEQRVLSRYRAMCGCSKTYCK